MKYLLSILSICITAIAFADQRMETDGDYAHFQVDPNNADNEIYFSGCKNTIETANGVANGRAVCKDEGALSIPWAKYITVHPRATRSLYAIGGKACAMVTSNYSAATDTLNRTEYNTNDSKGRYLAVKNGARWDIEYELICSNGVQ